MSISETRLATAEVLVAKDAIREMLFRYCRAIDRCDISLLRSVYWPESIDNHGIFNGNALEFCDFIIPLMSKAWSRSMHHLTNIHIDVHAPNRARGETYFFALHESDGDGQMKEHVVAGRYLDEFTCRGADWRVATRTVLLDWTQERVSASNWGRDSVLAPLVRGARFPDDLSYSTPGSLP